MNNKVPITRLSKFFSQDDFDINIQMGQEYLHGDLNMKLALYRVDRQNTVTDDIYAEVGKDQVKYLPPIEFNALVKIDEPKNSSYKNGLNRYAEPGNLTLSVYISHLEELNIDIRYGDFIGYSDSEEKLRYYTVSNDGRVTSDMKHTYGGYKKYYRTIIAAPVTNNEFNGL